MSDTPRTDAAATISICSGVEMVRPGFARELERRVAELEQYDVRRLSICEAGAFNPSILEYMKHWEGRVEKAERNEQDAARYRYLVGGCRFAETDPCWDTKESLDAAIDKKMREAK